MSMVVLMVRMSMMNTIHKLMMMTMLHILVELALFHANRSGAIPVSVVTLVVIERVGRWRAGF
jgi:hypothetical protein